MKKLSKLVQSFLIILFATTANITILGISQEEKNLIECNRKLDKIQEIESSGHYKMQKLLAQRGYLLLLGTSVGFSLLVSYWLSFFMEKNAAIQISAPIAGVIAYNGGSIVWETQQYIKNSEKLKKDIIITKEEAMKAFQKSIKKQNN